MARILMLASEAAPFAKTGGLADVVGGLSAALHELGQEVAVLLPRYRAVHAHDGHRIYDDLPVWLNLRRYQCSIFQAFDRGVPYYFLDCPELYDRDGLYADRSGDFADNHIRYAILPLAAFAVARYLFRPDIMHCHDWQTGLVPAYLRRRFDSDPTFIGIKSLLTIHNLGYQGNFSSGVFPLLGLPPDTFRPDGLEFHGRTSYLKAGIWYSDTINTVSHRYAEEIQTPDFGFGLDGVLRARRDRLSGILNGVDYTGWDPRSDTFIAANYSPLDLAGKRRCKAALLAEAGLPPEALDKPLIGIVSRFAWQKGFQLLRDIALEFVGEDLLLVALGTGEPELESFFRDLAAGNPGKIATHIGWDNRLAHKIEAGADMFLMPSLYEPCGLNQIYSMRYGTIPIVHATGGLDDTVDEETGFKFHEFSGRALLAVIRAALAAYRDQDAWQARMLAGMNRDFSWSVSAHKYLDLYTNMLSSQAAG
jgi:starch synthase